MFDYSSISVSNFQRIVNSTIIQSFYYIRLVKYPGVDKLCSILTSAVTIDMLNIPWFSIKGSRTLLVINWKCKR